MKNINDNKEKHTKTKIHEIGEMIAHVLEIIMAIFVLVAIGVQLFRVGKELIGFISGDNSESFLELLASILVVVVGIEFFALLCKPNMSRVFEVIVFVLARHMIVYDTSALEDLLVVVSIVIVGFISILVKHPTMFHKKNKTKDDTEKLQDEKIEDE